jgi:uncharacterized protein YkwD
VASAFSVTVAIAAAAAASAQAQPVKTSSQVVGALPNAAAATSAGATANAARRCRRTVLCLVNRQRARHGVRRLRADRRLARAARRHARDMARRRYFAHQRSGGPSLRARTRRAGFRGRATGETIAWGCGSSGTPRATVRAWMRSPGHRAVILSGHYGRGGTGIAGRAPVRCGQGRTYVLDVGRR